MVKEISALEFEQEIMEKKGNAVIDCYADWCMPCKVYSTVFSEVASELENTIPFYKLNIDAAPAIAHLFGVQGVPTTLLFKEGKLVDRLVGVHAAQDLKQWILGHL